MSDFMFERLEVYQRSLVLVEKIDFMLETSKVKIPYPRVDQLSRASLSIPLNIAEGNGRWHAKDRKRFFTIARGSAFECVPILQILKRKKAIAEDNYIELYDSLKTISKMLSALIKRENDRI
jgi:four helix bundle protein